MHHKRYLIVIGLAFVCLLLSVILELILHGQVGHHALLQAGESFFRELGFAFVIAWMISVGIEAHARKEDGERAESLRRLVALDVFKGVFSERLPRAYIDRVIETHLYQVIIRRSLTVAFELKELSEEDAHEWGIDRTRFVAMTERMIGVFENTSVGSHSHLFTLRIPKVDGAADGYVTPLEIKIAGKPLTVEEIALARSYDEASSSFTFTFPFQFAGRQEVEVEICNRLLKYRSDTHVLAMGVATLELTIEVVSEFPAERFGIRGTGPGMEKVEAGSGGNKITWRASSAVIANESAVLWWNDLAQEVNSG